MTKWLVGLGNRKFLLSIRELITPTSCEHTRVYFFVLGQMIMPDERLPTFITLIPFVIVVNTEMKPVNTVNK